MASAYPRDEYNPRPGAFANVLRRMRSFVLADRETTYNQLHRHNRPFMGKAIHKTHLRHHARIRHKIRLENTKKWTRSTHRVLVYRVRQVCYRYNRQIR